MRNKSEIALNLLGPSDLIGEPVNILMDIEQQHTGYTHIALKVESVDEAEKYFMPRVTT